MDKTTATLAATVRESGEGEKRWFCGDGVFTMEGHRARNRRGVPDL